MPSRNFQKQFVKAVENGIDKNAGRPLRHPGVDPKTQTIRADRKDGVPPRVGETEFLYTGMRTKSCRKLGEEICSGAYPLTLSWSWKEKGIAAIGTTSEYPIAGAEEIARADGFESFSKMLDWFEKTHGLPFSGWIIMWDAPGEGAS